MITVTMSMNQKWAFLTITSLKNRASLSASDTKITHDNLYCLSAVTAAYKGNAFSRSVTPSRHLNSQRRGEARA